MNRLHQKGFIGDPVGKVKSVALTEEGEAMAERLAQKLFGKQEIAGSGCNLPMRSQIEIVCVKACFRQLSQTIRSEISYLA